MSSATPTSHEAVVKVLASQGEMTNAQVAAVTGLGRSTAGKALAALERAGMARRSPGGRRRAAAARPLVGRLGAGPPIRTFVQPAPAARAARWTGP
jgi:DNA-binding transcriptional ArsR family regulator